MARHLRKEKSAELIMGSRRPENRISSCVEAEDGSNSYMVAALFW
jgi:hypothetical protein